MANGSESKPGAGASGSNGFPDFTKLFGEMKMPAMPDMEAFLSANRRNMEAFTAANKVAVEGAQAVARRHLEIMQQSMTEMTDAMKALAAMEGPQEKAARQADMLKQAYERAVAHMSEMRDLIQKSNAEALDLLNKRFAEAMDEVKALTAKAK